MRDDGDVDTIRHYIASQSSEQSRSSGRAPDLPRGACNDRDQTKHSETQKYFNYTDSGSFVILFESQL